MTQEKKTTVGKEAYDRLIAGPNEAHAIDLEHEMHKDYESNIIECIQRAKKVLHDPFYVVVETKKERLLENVIRNYFFYRQSCPTPTYDQTVYYVNPKTDVIEFMWVVPSKDTCQMMVDNQTRIHPEEHDLLNFVLLFESGKLLEMARFRNNEFVKPSHA